MGLTVCPTPIGNLEDVTLRVLSALRDAVTAWRRDEHAVIRIVHPGGERGSLWGREVHDWLVALGVPPARLAILAGGPRDDAVLLRVVPAP